MGETRISVGDFRRRRGIAMIYTIVAMLVLLGFCSLAVDFGRVEVAKTELRRTADAAARAAVANLSAGNNAAVSAAISMAANNPADGYTVTLVSASPTSGDVQVGWWNTSTRSFVVNSAPLSAAAPWVPAVKVIAQRSASENSAIPLLFGSILGVNSNTVTATTVATLNVVSETAFVSAHGNLWLSGEPTGTLASQPDPGYFVPGPGQNPDHLWQYDIAGPQGGSAATGEPYSSPLQASIPIAPGATIQISNVSGLASNDGQTPPHRNPDGSDGGTTAIYSDDGANPSLTQGSVTISGSEHGIANIATPIDSFLGVFLTSSVPDSETTPTGLDFSTSTAQGYASISPLVQQPFYIGYGQSSNGTQQSVIVPQGATRLFLGTMDGHEWSNNSGGFTATITQTYITVVQ